MYPNDLLQIPQVNTFSLPVELTFRPRPLELGGDLLMVGLVTSDGDVSDRWRLKYGDPPDKRKFLSLLVLPGLLLRLKSFRFG